MTQEEYEVLTERAVNNFADRDYFTLMEEAMGRVDPKFDKRPGSMVWNGSGPAVAEVAQAYTAVDFSMNNSFILTATRPFLIRRAADRSISPTPATRAIYSVAFSKADNQAVSRGTRFSAEDLNFEVIAYPGRDENGRMIDNPENGELVKNGLQLIRCETAGTVGNSSSGLQLIPIEYVPGLAPATVGALETMAEDEEDTETLRARVIEAMRSIAFGGNQADYREKVLAIDGVGQCKVYPVWNTVEVDGEPYVPALINNAASIAAAKGTVDDLPDGDVKTYLTALLNAAGEGKLTVGGTVRVVVASTDPQHPAVQDAAPIKEILDPSGSDGEGEGLAPIGHVVTVTSVEQVPVTVSMTVEKDDDYDANTVTANIKDQLQEYIVTLAKDWSKYDHIKVSLAFVIYTAMQAEGVKDIDSDSVRINGSAADLKLGKDQVPVLSGDPAVTYG